MFRLLVIIAVFAGASAAFGQGAIPTADIAAQQNIQRDQLERYLDREIEAAEKVRARSWQRDFSSLQAYETSVSPWRARLKEWLGGMPYQPADLSPQVTYLTRTDKFAAFRVWLTALEDVQVYGILLLPRQPPAERLPAVIALHGLGGSPETVCGLAEEDDYNQRFGAKLAEHGFVVFAADFVNEPPALSHLDRKAKMVGQRIQGFLQFQIQRVVDYLQSRPDVDPARIGIYGISWGGRTALNAAALDTRIGAVVISGYFNDSTRKMVTRSPHYIPYIDTSEDYAFFERHALEFSDADIASLILPRPVFIENGSEDQVAHWPMAKTASARVQEYYRLLGVGENAVFHVFEGKHVADGEASIPFLAKHLNLAPAGQR